MWQNISFGKSSVLSSQKTKVFTYSGLTISLLCGAIALSGCSGSKRHAAFKGTGSPYYQGSGPLPKGGGVWKVGTPYKIAGKKYYPRENTNYDKVGIASWYGPKFNRRKTANGEWFNMNDLTAAHKTLPLPVFAKVTNVSNGKNVVVRINDRGPYAHNREIDLSKATARKLGVIARGTAKVRVQYLGKAPLDGRLFADMSKRDQKMLLAKINGNTREQYAEQAQQEDSSWQQSSNSSANSQDSSSPHDDKIYVQAASFSNQTQATIAKSRLRGAANTDQDKFLIAPANVGGRTWYRLRMGPFSSANEAQQALQKVQTAGHSRAIIVSD